MIQGRFNLNDEYRRLQEAADAKHEEEYQHYKERAERQAKRQQERQDALNALFQKAGERMEAERKAETEARIEKAKAAAEAKAIAAEARNGYIPEEMEDDYRAWVHQVFVN